MGPQVQPKCFRHAQHMRNNWELRKQGYLIRFGHTEALLLKKRTLNGHFSRPAETDPYVLKNRRNICWRWWWCNDDENDDDCLTYSQSGQAIFTIAPVHRKSNICSSQSHFIIFTPPLFWYLGHSHKSLSSPPVTMQNPRLWTSLNVNITLWTVTCSCWTIHQASAMKWLWSQLNLVDQVLNKEVTVGEHAVVDDDVENNDEDEEVGQVHLL